MSRPPSWEALYVRLTVALGGDRPSAEEWLREALSASWGALSYHDLPRRLRPLAMQRATGAMLRIEEWPTDLAFDSDVRDVVRGAFARHFGGIYLDGPPWRVAPQEDLPTYEEWCRSLLFE